MNIIRTLHQRPFLSCWLLAGLLGLSSGCSSLKETFVDPFTPGEPSPTRRTSSRPTPRPQAPAPKRQTTPPPRTVKKSTPKPAPAIPRNIKEPASLIPFGVVENFAKSSSESEYTKLKRFGGALRANDRRVVMVNQIVDDLKLAIEKYARLRGGEFRLEPIDFSTWEVNVFHNPSINANVMPGGKITVYDGILGLARDDPDAIAVILGHEIAHELLKHARNRATTQIGYAAILAVAEKNSSWANDPDKMRSLGTAVNVGGFLPWSRNNESAADHLGAILAAMAGYDISKGEWLWNQMSKASAGQAPPEWLSTHPAGQSRVNFFRTQAPVIQKKYGKYATIPLTSIK